MAPTELEIDRQRLERHQRTWYLWFSVLLIFFYGLGLFFLLAYPWYKRRYLPRFVRSLRYTLTDDVLIIHQGVFWKQETSIALWKITDVVVSQGPLMARHGLKAIQTQTASKFVGGKLLGLVDPDGVRAAILERMNSIRRRDSGQP